MHKKKSERKAQKKRRIGHAELIAQLAPEDSDPGNEHSVTDAVIEERRSGPTDRCAMVHRYEVERAAFEPVLTAGEDGDMPRYEERMRPRRALAGPLNNPLIAAYERLLVRLNKELDAAVDTNEKMALSQAARALVNAIETERLIHSPYEK